jgi:hypothetical protein
MTKTLLATIALTLATPALAELCKYEDDQGNITYSDTVVKGSRKVGCLGAVPAPVAPAAVPRADSSPAQAVPGARSQPAAEERRGELDARLAVEEERLRTAREELAQQESIRTGDERNYQRVLDRLKPYQEAVEQAERAVEAIRAEISAQR